MHCYCYYIYEECSVCVCVWMRQASYPCDLKNCSSMGSVFNLCATVLATWQTQKQAVHDGPVRFHLSIKFNASRWKGWGAAEIHSRINSSSKK